MSDKIDIAAGLRVPKQIPLNIKEYVLSEEVLTDLGVNNNLAYTYHDSLIVTCLIEKTKWRWEEVGEKLNPLLSENFTYPPSWIVNDFNYSLKSYNFFKIKDYIEDINEIKDILLPFFNKFILVHKGLPTSTSKTIEVGDLCKGWGSGTGVDKQYWSEAKYLNITGDNNPDNYMNYNPITVSLPNS